MARKKYKLDFESVPEECWYANLRSVLSQRDWDRVRRAAYARAQGKCTVCGARGRLEAHERWSYDEKKKLQKLEDVVALCGACHAVKHVSRSYLVGKGEIVEAQFKKVNGVSQAEYHEALSAANDEYVKRNEIEGWTTDISWLKEKFNIEIFYNGINKK